MSGLKRIPGFSRYGITDDGILVNMETGKELKTSPDIRGYRYTVLVDDAGQRKGVKRHRLVALAHLPSPPGNVEDYVVNHKDSTPGNDWSHNLEWCTQKKNVEHWKENGVKKKSIPLETLDVEDGKVTRYSTIGACSKDLGINRYSIHARLEHGPDYIWPEGKRYREGHSSEPWPTVKKLKQGRSRNIILRDLVNNHFYVYEKLSDVLPFIGYKLPAVWKWASDPTQPVLPGLYQIQFLDELKPFREVEDLFKELQDGMKSKVVFTFDSSWGSGAWYESAIKCADDNDLKPTALNHRLKSKGQKVFRDGKRYCYYDDLSDVQKKTIRYEIPPEGGRVQRPSKAAPFGNSDSCVKPTGCRSDI